MLAVRPCLIHLALLRPGLQRSPYLRYGAAVLDLVRGEAQDAKALELRKVALGAVSGDAAASAMASFGPSAAFALDQQARAQTEIPEVEPETAARHNTRNLSRRRRQSREVKPIAQDALKQALMVVGDLRVGLLAL